MNSPKIISKQNKIIIFYPIRRTALVADISTYPVQSGAADIQGNFNKPAFISRRTGIISPTWKGAAF